MPNMVVASKYPSSTPLLMLNVSEGVLSCCTIPIMAEVFCRKLNTERQTPNALFDCGLVVSLMFACG